MSTKSKKVAGCVRVSHVGRRDNFQSPDEQRAAIESLAEERGFKVARWVEEIDAPAGGGDKRQGWDQVREAVARGELDGVVVYDFSRWSRDTEKGLASIRQMREAGGDIWSAMERFDTTSPEGFFMLTSFLATAALQRATIGRRFTARRKALVEKGVHVAGQIPIGYLRGEDGRYIPDPETRDIVLGVFERRAKGESYAKIARWLAEQGHPRSAEGVVSMLRNPVYLGEARHGDTVTKNATRRSSPGTSGSGARRRPSPRRGGPSDPAVPAPGHCDLRQLRPPAIPHPGQQRRAGLLLPEDLRPAGLRSGSSARHLRPELPVRVRGRRGQRARAGGHGQPETWMQLPGDGRDVEEAQAAVDEARADLDGFRKDTKLRREMEEQRPGLYAETMGDYITAVNIAEAALAGARQRSTGGLELVGRLWNSEWGWAERREWIERVVRSVVVSKGREPLSRRCEVELRSRGASRSKAFSRDGPFSTRRNPHGYVG